MDAPVIYDVVDIPRYKFKRNPFKSCEDDPEGSFSQTPVGILHVEDIRAYIHCKYETIGEVNIYSELDSMVEANESMIE